MLEKYQKLLKALSILAHSQETEKIMKDNLKELEPTYNLMCQALRKDI